MNIIVCLKQILDIPTIKFDSESGDIDFSLAQRVMNPMDTYALEESLRIRERYGGKITIFTVGSKESVEVIREGIGLGVDEGFVISEDSVEEWDVSLVATALAKAIKKLNNYDIILCGKSSSDSDSACIGPYLAEILDISQVTFVKKIDEIKDNLVRALRMNEDGYDIVEVPLPVVITVVKEINEPRLPSLKGKMKAKSYSVPIWTLNDIGMKDEKSTIRVERVWVPPKRTSGRIFSGEVSSVVDELVKELREQHIL